MRPRLALTSAAAVVAAGLAGAMAPNAIAATPADAGPPTIADIHGTTFLSPYEGQTVSGVTGVVTAIANSGSSKGFYFQDPNPSPDPRSSNGLFVYNSSATKLAALHVGDAVSVSGKIADYYPDAPAATSLDLATTEVESSSWTVTSSGNPVPAPLVITPSSVPTQMAADDAGGDIESADLQPAKYALDFYKSHESELVEVDNARVIGPTDAYGELYVTTKPAVDATPRGGMVYPSYSDRDTGRLEVTNLPVTGAPAFPEASVGDTLTGATTGPLVYSEYGGYEIDASTVGALQSGGIAPEVTRKQASVELAIATYNVENLAPSDPASKFTALAQGVVHNLATPDIVALEEIQDNDGATDDGVVAADKTLTMFTDAIVAAGGPRYQWREIDPVNDADGGEPGGNIRSVFLFNPARVSFVDRPGGTSTTPVSVSSVHGKAELSVSPGRIDPGNTAAWSASRKPLVGQFQFHGQDVYVVANHFVAKLGDQVDEGRYQPPARSSETQRALQAQEVRGFVGDIQKIDPTANVVVVGDLNDYQFSNTASILTSGHALNDLIDRLPKNQQYTYDYDGQSEVLDHILTSPSILWADYDPVHINAEFANQTSDHDPQVVRIIPDDWRDFL